MPAVSIMGFLSFLQSAIFVIGYISSSNLFPEPLTAEEEKECLEKMKNGDEDAKNILIERNLRLVAHIAKKYATTNIEQEDLISIGTIGLIKGINSFNISFTIKASSLGQFQELLEKELSMFSSAFTNISRISLVGYGIMNNEEIIKKTLEIFNLNSIDIFDLQLEECRLSIMTKEKVSDKLLEQLHHELILK